MVDEFISRSPDETMRVAEEMVRRYGDGVFALYGELGSGKTVFVKGMALACGIAPESVVSPTFKILNVYRGEKILYHIDAYRLSCGDELLLAVGDFLEATDGVVVVEWADRVEDALTLRRVNVELTHISFNERIIRIRSTYYGQ